MFVFNEDSAKRLMTPWGKEVCKQLIDKDMKQLDLVKQLQAVGYDVNKHHISNLMYGIGVTTRADLIKEINRILEID